MANKKETQHLNSYFEELNKNISSKDLNDNIIKAKNIILDVRKKDKKIILAGNGASNLIAGHAALDFVNQIGVRTYNVNETSFVTAASNDFGYEGVFERYVNLFANKGDLLVLISSSGKSKNVINAALLGKKKNCKVITFTGFEEGNDLKKLGNVNFWVDSKNYNIVESIHNAWIVSICENIMNDEKSKIGIHGIEF